MHPNILQLQIIRGIVAVLQLLTLAYAKWALDLDLDYSLILAILLGVALVHGALLWRLRHTRMPSLREFLVLLWFDILGFAPWLYFTGGTTSPFVVYLLVPVIIASASLPWRYAVATALAALTCYTVLLFGYLPLPDLLPAAAQTGAELPTDATATMPDLQGISRWIRFAASAGLIIYFVAKLASELRQREQRLRRYREETLRNEQILAVAIQAAGTAHTLGTPLGTMSALVKQMQQEHGGNAALQRDLDSLEQQLALWRDALQELSRKANFKQPRHDTKAIAVFLQELVQHWQLLRPEVPCHFNLPVEKSPTISFDPTLEQALINLLNSAADASPDGISIQASWDKQLWHLHIRGQGPGIPREMQEQLGTTIFNSSANGTGVGLMLHQATFSRFDGSVSMYAQQPSGALMVIELPLGDTEE